MIKYIFLALLLAIPVVSAAQLQGNVYNNYLEPSMAVVKINTDPVQKLVVKNSYRFNIPIGTYTITATYNNLKTEETVTIKQDGIYSLDLIMFPSFEDEESLLNFNVDTSYEKSSYWYVYLIIIGLVLIGISYLIKKKKTTIEEKKEEIIEDELTAKLISFIKEKGGRITQKDIRKQFPFSEAKISLLVTELESKGKLRKIKKGRTNIIVLQ